jgi:putative addiction module component (TIGR02574 family)
MRINNIKEINQLSTAEKILLLEDLWDSIIRDEASIPLPQSHKEELERRLKRYMAHPGDLLSLEELQERLESRK